MNLKNKFILDACCGGRLFWYNKHHPNALYIDYRIREKGHDDFRPNHSVKPDIKMNFTDLKFPDKSFKLVVMDPPHIISKPESFRIVKYYGSLVAETWQSDIKKGFDECWRVLDDYGILIFKWNETDVSKKKILYILNKDPLFGHTTGKVKTHWFCFMKIPIAETETQVETSSQSFNKAP